MPTDNGRDLRRAMERAIGFVSGWRAALILVSIAAAFLIGLVAGGGSLAAATGAALVAAVVLGAVVVMVALEANRISEWSTRLAGVAEPARAADGRLDLIDAVVGGSTRHWRDPTLLPWPEDGGEAVDLARSADAFEPSTFRDHGHPGGVVAPVLQPSQTLEDERNDVLAARDAHDSAHSVRPSGAPRVGAAAAS